MKFFFIIYSRRLLILSMCFFVWILGSLHADDETISQPDLEKQATLYIGLGADCRVATKIGQFGVRKAAFPFDWILSVSSSGISHLIRDGFEFFLDERFFVRHKRYLHFVVNSYYNIEFRHEWNSYDKYKETLNDIQLKYQRRIDRFYRLRQYKGKVFFIRISFDPEMVDPGLKGLPKENLSITNDDAIELRDALKERFPDLKFKLAVVNYLEVMDVPLEIEDVIEFKFNRGHDNEGFSNMFNSLKSLEW